MNSVSAAFPFALDYVASWGAMFTFHYRRCPWCLGIFLKLLTTSPFFSAEEEAWLFYRSGASAINVDQLTSRVAELGMVDRFGFEFSVGNGKSGS